MKKSHVERYIVDFIDRELTTAERKNLRDYINSLYERFPDSQCYVTGCKICPDGSIAISSEMIHHSYVVLDKQEEDQ